MNNNWGRTMSAIASATASPQMFSPLSRLKTELASEVSAGTISSADQSALSSALDDIDASMKAGRSTSGSQPPSSDEMQAKIDSLIDDQVSSGKLTSDQAEELKEVFANTFAEGAGGPPPGGPPASDSTDSAAAASGTSGSSSTSSTDPADTDQDGTVTAAERAAYEAANASDGGAGDSGMSKLLSDFLSVLKESQGSGSSYGSGGNSLTSQLKSLIVDYTA